ncbi:UdgX family uracil-DNA binding protein [Pseudoduganella ginsengisoli]|uniref:Type-4 uracil-DNA glycosylase n=1 Tax=Pseudoduganella ginsengisoli TaxID=1462440 RepID=A0A6L6PUJ9_9BURK|nr:UdgX family uracil-DNA binding protein [Pseudoduganella ginsengisoli]MTW01203.1 UdgX family uracil-DNA binding protein [Pseudoduganella ginsengisoli]
MAGIADRLNGPEPRAGHADEPPPQMPLLPLPAAAGRVAVAADSFDAWRAAVRVLIVRCQPPESVEWLSSTGMDRGGLFAEAAQLLHADADAPLLRLPRTLVDMLGSAACFRAEDRWAFLYRVVWRWQQGQREVATMADDDGGRLQRMVKAVQREEHDMHAYLRFRERPEHAGAPRFIAWFEPAHDVLPRVARHFAGRMGGATFMIATPQATVLWDGARLHDAAPLPNGAASLDQLDDQGEALWLAYYRNIFNPARLNPDVMHSHVRHRFWKHMPEAALVPELVSQAAAGARRTGQSDAVGKRHGATIPIAADEAQPQRQQPHKLDECRRCDLWQHATQAVPGEGAKHARIMLVGEQPGDQEDLQGHPFVGPAGTLLDKALEQAGVDRAKVYVTNAVKHFKWEPRGKRRLHKTPAQKEVAACHYWLEAELAKVQPDVVVALGSTALKSVLEDGRARLKDFMEAPVRHGNVLVVATYHPAFILRVPEQEAREQAMEALVHALRTAHELTLSSV